MTAQRAVRLVTIEGPTRSGDFAVIAQAYAQRVAAQAAALLGEDPEGE